jgi:general secretion pathway protein E
VSPDPRLSFGFARSEQVALDGDRLLYGPAATSLGLREAIRRVAPLEPEPVALSEAAFEAALAGLYGDGGGGGDVSFDLGSGDGQAATRDLLDDDSDAPVIQFVNQLLRRAVQSGASDLHIEPHETGLRARLRIDGFLQTVSDRDDVPVRRVVSRIKVMAGLDIAETRLPQDGRIALRLGGRAVDARVSTLPGGFGERVVLRILDRRSGLVPLADLGLSPQQAAQLERLAAQPDGIILATGPTGSGKTTTLYSLLKLAQRHDRNLVTVEDPIEYNLDGLNQTQVNADIGMTFAAGLRAALRQDPDVILVGEIRDAETAGIAAQAALTGHLVFSSLHANSSVGSVVRLRDLGVDNYLIAATLRGVIAQRLLRNLCPACRTTRPPTDAEAKRFRDAGLPVPAALGEPKGCDACHGTGYSGRSGVYEIVEVGDTLRAAIEREAVETDLQAIAAPQSPGLGVAALQKVAGGTTSLAEVERVLGDRA